MIYLLSFLVVAFCFAGLAVSLICRRRAFHKGCCKDFPKKGDDNPS